MVYKIVTDYVRPEVRSSHDPRVSIYEADNGTYVISSIRYSSNYFRPYDVISYMSMFAEQYCGRILTASFINDGVVL